MSSIFWLEDPNQLLKNAEIWPMPNMNKTNKFNAISRLIIILTVLGYLTSKSIMIIISGILTLSIIGFIYYNSSKINSTMEGFKNLNNANQEIQTISTEQNPLSNVQLPEIQFDPERPPAPPAYTEEEEKENNNMTKNMIVNASFQGDKELKKKLFKDLGDELEFDRSMINFYTTPNTKIPNDQDKFAQFCYGNMPSCKEGDPLACEKRAFRYRPP